MLTRDVKPWAILKEAPWFIWIAPIFTTAVFVGNGASAMNVAVVLGLALMVSVAAARWVRRTNLGWIEEARVRYDRAGFGQMEPFRVAVHPRQHETVEQLLGCRVWRPRRRQLIEFYLAFDQEGALYCESDEGLVPVELDSWGTTSLTAAKSVDHGPAILVETGTDTRVELGCLARDELMIYLQAAVDRAAGNR